MKTINLLFAMLILPIFAFAQNQTTILKSEVTVTPPVFTGVENVNMVENSSYNQTINDYLFNNIHLPKSVAEWPKEGISVIRFTVAANGELQDFKVINSLSHEIDKEVIRALKKTNGMWLPGRNNDESVEMEKEVSLVIIFNDEQSDNPMEYLKSKSINAFNKANKLFVSKNRNNIALKYYDQSIQYRPYETSSLLMRGLCRYSLGDKEGARSDWERINEIGRYDASEFITNLYGLEGYAEMINILNK